MTNDDLVGQIFLCLYNLIAAFYISFKLKYFYIATDGSKYKKTFEKKYILLKRADPSINENIDFYS